MEYHVSADDPNVADRESGRLLLAIDQPYVNHNGGTIHFGPDGYLYIAIGDGGMAGDPYDNAQDLAYPARQDPADRRRRRGRATPTASRRTTRIADGAGRAVELDHRRHRRDEGLSLEAGVLPPGRAAGDLGLRPAQPLAVQL